MATLVPARLPVGVALSVFSLVVSVPATEALVKPTLTLTLEVSFTERGSMLVVVLLVCRLPAAAVPVKLAALAVVEIALTAWLAVVEALSVLLLAVIALPA